jgi:hypothetical protein
VIPLPPRRGADRPRVVEIAPVISLAARRAADRLHADRTTAHDAA